MRSRRTFRANKEGDGRKEGKVEEEEEEGLGESEGQARGDLGVGNKRKIIKGGKERGLKVKGGEYE